MFCSSIVFCILLNTLFTVRENGFAFAIQVNSENSTKFRGNSRMIRKMISCPMGIFRKRRSSADKMNIKLHFFGGETIEYQSSSEKQQSAPLTVQDLTGWVLNEYNSNKLSFLEDTYSMSSKIYDFAIYLEGNEDPLEGTKYLSDLVLSNEQDGSITNDMNSVNGRLSLLDLFVLPKTRLIFNPEQSFLDTIQSLTHDFDGTPIEWKFSESEKVSSHSSKWLQKLEMTLQLRSSTNTQSSLLGEIRFRFEDYKRLYLEDYYTEKNHMLLTVEGKLQSLPHKDILDLKWNDIFDTPSVQNLILDKLEQEGSRLKSTHVKVSEVVVSQLKYYEAW